ncbi:MULTISPECIES: hypothetical protein [unclassified Burkholderia]|uniref:hypothetical protein n=1 Tax=unclassified Burkholderia TaxID=2613784 RepID=UPI002AB0B386|nr:MULTISPECIES: hypothetical protein [unclassified Burkholderia]
MSPQEAARFCFVRGLAPVVVFFRVRAGAGWEPAFGEVFVRFARVEVVDRVEPLERIAPVAPRSVVAGAAASTASVLAIPAADAPLRAGDVEALPARAFATDLPPAAGAFRFGVELTAGLSCFAAVLRDAAFFASAASPFVARLLAAFVFARACALCPDFEVLPDRDAFPSLPAFAAFLTGRSVSTACIAISAGCGAFFITFFRRRVPAFKPSASTSPPIVTTAGSTDSSVRNPAASSRFCAAVSRFTQYSARDAIDRSGSGNDASTARGLRERV